MFIFIRIALGHFADAVGKARLLTHEIGTDVCCQLKSAFSLLNKTFAAK